MYKIATTNLWHNGERHDSLISAVKAAKALRLRYVGVQFDVIRPIDRNSQLIVWTVDGWHKHNPHTVQITH